jgi:hypothetical protein
MQDGRRRDDEPATGDDVSDLVEKLKVAMEDAYVNAHRTAGGDSVAAHQLVLAARLTAIELQLANLNAHRLDNLVYENLIEYWEKIAKDVKS